MGDLGFGYKSAVKQSQTEINDQIYENLLQYGRFVNMVFSIAISNGMRNPEPLTPADKKKALSNIQYRGNLTEALALARKLQNSSDVVSKINKIYEMSREVEKAIRANKWDVVRNTANNLKEFIFDTRISLNTARGSRGFS